MGANGRKHSPLDAIVGISGGNKIDMGTKKGNISTNKHECEYRRPDMCLKHGKMGTKYVETTKLWTKKNDGMFGYVQRRKTKYAFHYATQE